MITKENLKSCFDLIDSNDIKEMDKAPDYLMFKLSVFNVGAIVNLECVDYSEEIAQEIEDNGDLFCDKDDFLRLFIESGSNNPVFNDYL